MIEEIARDIASIQANSSDALSLIAEAGREPSDVDLVCWHCRSLAEISGDSSEEFYDRVEAALLSSFSQMQLSRIAFGSFELWEKSFPTDDWLKTRLGQFSSFGEQTMTCLQGWSYEPSDRPRGWIPQAWADDEESKN